MEGYQTPNKQHIENWMLVVMLSCWLFYTAAPVVGQVCQKWQKSSEPTQENGCLKTMFQARKGEKQTKRERYKVYKKKAKVPI